MDSNLNRTDMDELDEREISEPSRKYIVGKKSDHKAEKFQFSSEKLLEDELVMRMDTGVPVFGRRLKIYRRHGEYGRQYIIPAGRLDLLAEDGNGNLYIIELKKDDGYDDAYAQISTYLEWFEKNKTHGARQIYGIICLSNPSEKLKAAVRKDKRVQLFHYSITYEEIT